MDIDVINNALSRTGGLSIEDEADNANKQEIIARIARAMGVNFSEEQRAVITHGGAPLAVISCAGSGKTTVTIAKLLYRQLYFGTPAFKLLAITFSKDAAKEIESRYKVAVRALNICENGELPFKAKGEPTFKTFHALFYSFVKRFVGEDVRVVSEGSYTYELVREIPFSVLYERTEVLKDILDYRSNLINNSKSYDGVTSASVKGAKVAIESDAIDPMVYFKVIEKYNELKQARREIDFDDMLVYMYKMTVATPNRHLISAFQSAYEDVFIDEYQDISEIIISISDALIQDKNKLTVIGDDDQAIYSFRGSRSTYILNFRYRYLNADVLYLGDNYRCPANILNPVIPAIEKNAERLPKIIRAAKEGGELYFYPTDESYASLIEAIMDDVAVTRNLDNIAMLVRLNVQKMIYSDLLANAGIPVDVGNIAYSMREHKVYKTVRGVIDAIRSEDNQAFSQYGRMFLRSINYNVTKRYGQTVQESWYEEIITRDRYLLDAGTLQIVRHIKETNNAQDIIRHVWLLLKDYYQIQDSKGFGNYEQTCAIVKYLSRISEGATYQAFVANEMRKQMFMQMNTNMGGTIKVMTLHSVKGREFDSVYLVGIDSHVFPNPRHMEYLKNLKGGEKGETSELEQYISEELRLFYVGWTRAKRRLVVAFDKKNPSMFLEEIEHPTMRHILAENKQAENR